MVSGERRDRDRKSQRSADGMHPAVRRVAVLLQIEGKELVIGVKPPRLAHGNALPGKSSRSGAAHRARVYPILQKLRDTSSIFLEALYQMRVGILTGGGDCPGLNAVIRAVV